jgi:hypothetical protein
MPRYTLLFALLIRGSVALSQTRPSDESRAEFAARDPLGAVREALNGQSVLVRRDASHTAGSRTWQVPVSTPASAAPVQRCFIVYATASGTQNVTLRASAGRQELLAATVINAAAANGVAMPRVCVNADRNTRLQLTVRATAATRWALAVTDAPVETMTFDPHLDVATNQARDRLAAALANGGSGPGTQASADAGVTQARIALGGTETDYIATQIRDEYRATPSVFATIPVSRTTLNTAEEHSVRTRLTAGRCYEAIAVGTPSVTDINVVWIDSTNARVAQDTGHRNKERVRYCAQISASFTVTARVFAGFGPVGLQLLDVGPQ